MNKVHTKVIPGIPLDTLRKRSEQDDAFMMILGATGAHGAIDRLFGRLSSRLAQRAYCPVLLVPKGARYQEYDHILYASNFESADSLMLQQIIHFANIFRSTLHFIHIEQENQKEDFSLTEELIMEKLMEKGAPAFSFNMHTLPAQSVLEGLHTYADEHEADLIVLANRQRSFMESILGQSMTKKIALGIKYPVLVYHMV